MSDKPGLICPICNEGLATFSDSASVNGIIKCLRCGYEFMIEIVSTKVEPLEDYIEREVVPFSTPVEIWCVDSARQWCLVSPANEASLSKCDCDNACAWVEPYGWVPEAGCPVHDLEN